MTWRIFHKAVTGSTNHDARGGKAGDVFSADFQTAGRGRLDHKWLSRRGENLMMSAVVDVSGLAPEHVATFPLVVGLSVCEAVSDFLPPDLDEVAQIKWPNDVLVHKRKIAGILCELDGNRIIAGVGVNVREKDFPVEIADRATSLAMLGARDPSVEKVRNAVLKRLGENAERWRESGFEAVLPQIRAHDCLKGREVLVMRADGDEAPAKGICGGIADDGSLLVADGRVYAGEAHVCSFSP